MSTRSRPGGGAGALRDLEMRGDFIRRHIGPDDAQIAAMLATLGLDELEDVVRQAVPADIVSTTPLSLTETISEQAVLAHLRRMRGRNRVLVSMIGMGYHGTVMPEVIKRNVLENPGWYTAYTPYQAEISQGRLEALINFQQMVIDLTGMEVANASLLDEATAAAEAMAMCQAGPASRAHRSVSSSTADCHPQTLAVLRDARGVPSDFEIVVGDPAQDLLEAWRLLRGPAGPLSRAPVARCARSTAMPCASAPRAQGALVDRWPADLLEPRHC